VVVAKCARRSVATAVRIQQAGGAAGGAGAALCRQRQAKTRGRWYRAVQAAVYPGTARQRRGRGCECSIGRQKAQKRAHGMRSPERYGALQ